MPKPTHTVKIGDEIKGWHDSQAGAEAQAGRINARGDRKATVHPIPSLAALRGR